ncbi:serine protease [Mycobacterium malmoense]|uniref:Trypsin n=1 Tax=Mycobacterium malmoense TaxID=1780 RepID=A0ABX3SVU4_MYCMA|nr:trypsin-like peptidase domain-containing protein [Mycobacterium malmoense]OIN80580.1 trypsin [Mycobacterium malmoense]ORA84261.1 trypsin [Mycobacterium malmoense]QZA19219.1 serine protease [Mycobacterium malmoense]UNB95977.1 trypsin-like peptidase domain-containing protein [Mycobacterium malmoense]
MRLPMVLLCPVVGLGMVLTSCRQLEHASTPATSSSPAGGPVQRLSQPQQTVVAAPVDPDRRVGAIFLDSGTLHVCTGSVVHSASGSLVITAAHCLAGASRISFVPGLAGDAAPADVWTADAVYLDPRWLAGKDPHADYAIARVSNQAGGSVESHVGLALTLGSTPPPGSHVTVMGYPAGVGGTPIGCQAATSVNDSGFPSLACEGLVGGTSGAPWVSGTTLTGLIGGFERGGCAENVSYSAPFDEHIAQLLERADAGGPGDPVPNDLDDSC